MLRSLLAALFCVFVSSCKNPNRPIREGEGRNEDQLHRFYDFNLNVDIESPNSVLEERYLLLNAGKDYCDETHNQVIRAGQIKQDTLYHITYQQRGGGNPRIDTALVPLAKAQIDTVYTLTVSLFDIEPKVNLTKDSIPVPQHWDGRYALVTFDLGFRGDRYQTSGRAEEKGKDRASLLYQYLLKLGNSR